MIRSMSMHRSGLAVLTACLLAAVSGCGAQAGDIGIAPEIRAAGLRFDGTVAPADREWIVGAIASARPEAQQLIDDIDGMVVINTFSQPGNGVVGLMRPTGPGAYSVGFNLAYLNGERKIDRGTTVLHELGHVVDHRLVPPGLRDELAAALPRSGACLSAETGDCTAPEERFADTFAKWALRGAVSLTGAGYSVIAPASLEDWGAPLSLLAIQIDVASR
jgi:hypothetical protein